MKKFITIILILFVAGWGTATAQSQSAKFSSVSPSGDTLFYYIQYPTSGDPYALVTFPNDTANYFVNLYLGYPHPSGAVVVPDSVSYNDSIFPVVALGAYAFCYCTDITSLTLPPTLSRIGGFGLYHADSITDLTFLSDSVSLSYYSMVLSSNLVVHYPCNGAGYYEPLFGDVFTLQPEGCHSLQVLCNDSTWGQVLIRQRVGNTYTLLGVPHAGSGLVGWSTGAIGNPLTITLTGDSTVTAFFCQNQTDTLWVYDTVQQTVYDTIYHPVTVYDTVQVDSTVTIPLLMHDTVWVITTVYDTVLDDVTLLDTLWVVDTTIVIEHRTDTLGAPPTYYLLTVSSDNPTRGLAAGSGNFPEDTEVEIAAIPLTNSRFLGWDDASTENPRRIVVDTVKHYHAQFEALSIEETRAFTWQVYTERGALCVQGVEGRTVRVFDNVGRLLCNYSNAAASVRFVVPATGSYVVQVDGREARKVVVVR